MKFHLNIHNFIIQSLLVAFVCGCASSEEIAEQKRLKLLEQEAAWEGVRTAMKDKCMSYGFKLGTDAYASCIMKLDGQVRDELARQDQKRQLNQRCMYLLANPQGGLNDYSRCMEGVTPKRPKTVVCTPLGNGSVSCADQ